MEGSSQRRLDCLSRHLLLPPPDHVNPVLYQALLKNGEKITLEPSNPVVIGGMVLDVHATPSVPPHPRSTTPGKVHYVLGGVARNIAECISKLGVKPYMISAVGTDMPGKLLLEYWNSAGLSTEGIRKHADIQTAVICITFDTEGEVVAGVASVEAIEKYLTSSWIQQFRSNISSAPILMVDANLNSSALEASCRIAAESNTPVWFEPVSVAKSRRISTVAKYVTFASPNEAELVAMANALSGGNAFQFDKDDSKMFSVQSLLQALKPAIMVLLEKGIKMVIVTLGVNGVFLCARWPFDMRNSLERVNKHGRNGELYDTVSSKCPPSRHLGATQKRGNSQFFAIHLPALSASVVRLTGAGDCLVGGTLTALCSGLDVIQSVAFGIAVAKTAVEAEANVPAAFSLGAVADDARLVYAGAKDLFQESML
ncbi:hypothetical protein Tsubulata_001836 [Turnera subulata]|uniref:Carbohydrate kinase PfkB domain-containing protein n=1 Tax=Turnera subulata TaxID=218843 RepID=A0A9Q0G2S5_9ROSI|nr:hypothetical protein Tsubulata_001836 [Turnera subulata]